MPSEVRQKKIMEKLNRAQKCSILGPQNLGSGGARAPGDPPLDPHLKPPSYLIHDCRRYIMEQILTEIYWNCNQFQWRIQDSHSREW